MGEQTQKNEDLTQAFKLNKEELYKAAFSHILKIKNQANNSETKTNVNVEDFFKSVLGPLYTEEMSGCLKEIVKTDEEGNLNLNQFDQALSLKALSPEVISAMNEVIKTSPDFVEKLANWKGLFSVLGMDIGEQEIQHVIDEAQKKTADFIQGELEKLSNSGEKKTKMLDAVKDNIHLFGLGKNTFNSGETQKPEESELAKTEDDKKI